MFKGFYKLNKYYNFITTNNIHIYEDRAILRKWICIKIDLISFFVKLNKRIKRWMRKRKKGASEEAHISLNLAA